MMAVDPQIPADLLTERDVLALTIWAEARNQPLLGQIAVGFVILNRLRSGRWGKTLKAVCFARKQFSCWSPAGGAKNFERVLQACDEVLTDIRDPLLRQALWIADGLIKGAPRNPIGTAMHYLNPRAVTRMPSWADPRKRSASIGDHDFYTGVA